MEIQITGTIISKYAYASFDEIFTILTTDGALLTCMALGTRKIESKNARSLIIGNKCNFEIFLARQKDKMSKLKKLVAISEIEHDLSQSYSLNLLFEVIEKNSFNFNSNQFIIDTKKLIKEIGDDKTLIFTILSIMKYLGTPLYLSGCIVCQKKEIKTISFDAGGIKCKAHYQLPDDGYLSLTDCQLIVSVAINGYKPLDVFDGSLSAIIKGVILFFEKHSGINSLTLISLKRKYFNVIKDQ